MKKLFGKMHHHFTKRELAAEEIIIIVIICILLAAGSYAASALLPMRVNIIQCGERKDLPERCREDQRCCALMEQTMSPAERQQSEAPVYDDGAPEAGENLIIMDGKTRQVFE